MKTIKASYTMAQALIRRMTVVADWRYDARTEELVLSGTQVRVSRHMEVRGYSDEYQHELPLIMRLIAKRRARRIMRYINSINTQFKETGIKENLLKGN